MISCLGVWVEPFEKVLGGPSRRAIRCLDHPKPIEPGALPFGNLVLEATPNRLGPYRLEGLLGRGGMGAVHVAWDERLERRVALKRVSRGPASEAADAKLRARLRREAKLAAQLAHPSIVRVFDLLEEEEGDWIVMELVEGTSLAEVLVDGPLDVATALSYGRQITEGLTAAHGLGIVHRDLKTENVVVTEDQGSSVKILDFGLAKRLAHEAETEVGAEATTLAQESALSVPGMVLGTGRAMAPEQARGLDVGPRSDLFSLGVLLYECLSGVSPFRGKTFHDTLVRVATHRPAPLDELVRDVPPDLASLVQQLLSKAPELRPASAREVAVELARLEEESRSGARRPSSGERAVEAEAATRFEESPPEPGARRFASKRVWATLLALGFLVSGLALVVDRVLDPSKSPDTAAPTSERTALISEAIEEDPLALYEEGMREVARVDRPESTGKALVIFQRLLELDGTSAAAHAGLARAYWHKAEEPASGGDPIFMEQAAAAAREAVRLDPYLSDARVSLGLVELSSGRSEEALRHLEEALVLEPSNPDAHFGLGRLAERANRPEDAESHYRQARTLGEVPRYFDTLGTLLFTQGRFDEAEQEFRAGLELAPDNIYALRNLGGLYFYQDRLDEAAGLFQQALRIRPDASLYSNLGSIFFLRGLYPRAAQAFEDALGTDGASHKHVYWLNLADAYRQMPGREEDAQLHYRRAIELLGEELDRTPGNGRFHSRRAIAWARSGNCRASREDLSLLSAPGTELDLYSLFRRAVTEELCGERDAALASLATVLDRGLPEAEVRREIDLVELRKDPRYHRLLMARDGG